MQTNLKYGERDTCTERMNSLLSLFLFLEWFFWYFRLTGLEEEEEEDFQEMLVWFLVKQPLEEEETGFSHQKATRDQKRREHFSQSLTVVHTTLSCPHSSLLLERSLLDSFSIHHPFFTVRGWDRQALEIAV